MKNVKAEHEDYHSDVKFCVNEKAIVMNDFKVPHPASALITEMDKFSSEVMLGLF